MHSVASALEQRYLIPRIRYSLLGEKAERFSVNSDTGEVTTLEPLDRELTPVYHLTLVAQDSSPTEPRAAAVNLTIIVKDLNDNAPRFSSPRYTAYVPDATKPGEFILRALILHRKILIADVLTIF